MCTNAGVIHHIEVAEDVNPASDGTNNQKMGDIDSTVGFKNLVEFGAGTGVVDTATPANAKGCVECHTLQGTVSAGGNVVNYFADIPPDRGILFTNDPAQGPPPATQTHLSEICTRIAASSQLAAKPSDQSLAVELCNRLAQKLP